MEPTIGHNSGATIAERLAVEFEPLLGDVDAFAKRCDTAPKEVSGPEEHEKLVALVKEVRSIASEVEASRKKAKDPFLKGGQEVDTFFGTVTERLTRIKQAFEKRVQIYLTAQAEKQRLEREEAAKRAREEQERLLAEAAAAEAAKEGMKSEVLVGQALVAEVEQKANEAAATGPLIDLSRTRTASGTSSISEVWTFEIEDLAKVDLNEIRFFFAEADIRKALGNAVRGGFRQVRGVRIFQTSKVNIR